MAQLSEWLQIMLAEIGRKQEEALRSAEEQQRRDHCARSHNRTDFLRHRLCTQAHRRRVTRAALSPLCYICVWLRG